jgi:adenylate cyclase
MVAKMTELNAEWRAEAEAAGRSYTEVAIGIGVNSGDCCVGNLGSYRRFDYSAIGDNVNLTSRLEGLTKVYGLPLVVGEDTAGRLPDLHFLEVDLVRVKGRTTPTRIFTLPSTLRAEAAALDVVWRLHEGFLRDYRNGDWTPARASLAELQANGPESLRGLYATYGQRIAKLAERGGETWDGVYELEEK